MLLNGFLDALFILKKNLGDCLLSTLYPLMVLKKKKKKKKKQLTKQESGEPIIAQHWVALLEDLQTLLLLSHVYFPKELESPVYNVYVNR